MKEQTLRDLQLKILEMMKFIDKICRENGIMYHILGGTALGAVRHKGFIPWDDDMDIFMTPENYEKFKKVFYDTNQEKFYLQEWKLVDDYVEQAKLRYNGTTLIESVFKNKKEMHQGIYLDIFILHKCPKNNLWIQKKLYYYSHFIVGVTLTKRDWHPRTFFQKVSFAMCKVLGNQHILNYMFKQIYRYDTLEKDYKYCFFIDRATFKNAIFDAEQFDFYSENEFEDMILYGPKDIKKYLSQVYGDYMKLPPEAERQKRVHAEIWDTEKDYREYLK